MPRSSLAAVKDLSAADAQLKAALKIAPDLANRDEVGQLRIRIAKDGACGEESRAWRSLFSTPA